MTIDPFSKRTPLTNSWPLHNDLFRCTTRAMLKWDRKQGIEVGIFCDLHTYGRQLNQPPQSTSPPPVAVSTLGTASGAVRRPLNRPLRKDRICLRARGQSTLIIEKCHRALMHATLSLALSWIQECVPAPSPPTEYDPSTLSSGSEAQ